MQTSQLYNSIVSNKNIFSAIYSLESYIFEKELLSNGDIKKYNWLKDKFDDNLNNEIIEECQKRIKSILEGDELFPCQIFFKIKKYNKDSNKVEFRPIHTAGLIDQICMVAMLSQIMFDDTSGKRKFSPISRLLPANFYGNLPSDNVKELFKPWHRQYKEYSAKAIEANKHYLDSKEYKYEVNLDLEKFFPSINPTFIYNYILNKWPVTATKDDKDCLKKVLEKLLFFNVNLPEFLKEEYYPVKRRGNDDHSYNIGIPQGLPQAYFFGNICMSIIAKHKNNKLKGDSFYYVDDSIVYTNTELTDEIITELEDDINTEINKSIDASFLNSPIRRFHNSIKRSGQYHIKIHQLGEKSTCSKISTMQNLYFLAKPASLFPFEIRTAQDEYEDTSLLSKLKAIVDTIDRLINEENDNLEPNESLLISLSRYRKFYINRCNLLMLNQSVGVDYEKNNLNEFISKHGLNTKPSKSVFFDKLKDDVFPFESKIIVQQLWAFEDSLKEFLDTIRQFEKSCFGKHNDKELENHLYYYKSLKAIPEHLHYSFGTYWSLQDDILISSLSKYNRTNEKQKVSQILKISEKLK